MNLFSMSRAAATLALSAALATAQSAPAPSSAPASTPAANPPRPDGLKSRLFQLQYRTPDSHFVDLLRPLGSGNFWAGITATDHDGMKAVTVRDFPENIAAIEDAIKRLDVPGPARKEMEFHIHVLFASKQDDSAAAVPDEIKDVLGTLRSSLNFRSYTPVASFIQRTVDGANFIEGDGQGEMAVRASKGEAAMEPIDIEWLIDRPSLGDAGGGRAAINLPKVVLSVYKHVGEGHGAKLAGIETNLTMKDGEKVVVGTATVRDKALIVIVTAKILD